MTDCPRDHTCTPCDGSCKEPDPGVTKIAVTPDSCVYDPDLIDLLHRELPAHGIELDIPHQERIAMAKVDFCTTFGIVFSRMMDDRPTQTHP